VFADNAQRVGPGSQPRTWHQLRLTSRKYRLDRACGRRQENDDFVRRTSIPPRNLTRTVSLLIIALPIQRMLRSETTAGLCRARSWRRSTKSPRSSNSARNRGDGQQRNRTSDSANMLGRYRSSSEPANGCCSRRRCHRNRSSLERERPQWTECGVSTSSPPGCHKWSTAGNNSATPAVLIDERM
jgi:hypothetical protein